MYPNLCVGKFLASTRFNLMVPRVGIPPGAGLGLASIARSLLSFLDFVRLVFTTS